MSKINSAAAKIALAKIDTLHRDEMVSFRQMRSILKHNAGMTEMSVLKTLAVIFLGDANRTNEVTNGMANVMIQHSMGKIDICTPPVKITETKIVRPAAYAAIASELPILTPRKRPNRAFYATIAK